MIVNLYVDHMMNHPPVSSEEVWNATQEHSHLFKEAARKLGMTPAEFKEFQNKLLDGKTAYVRLPHKLSGMAGDRHGYVYVVHNAYMPQSVYGWVVVLNDGSKVYVPQTCGNLSLLRLPAVMAVHHRPKHIAYVAPPPPVTPVIVNQPSPPPVYVPPNVVATTPNRGISPFFFLIPIAIGGIIEGVTHGPTPVVPPCNQGSNSMSVCRK
jgi:hypothetical protein